MITNRFEDFAQSLRVFSEQKLRFNELFLIDKDEAIGNVELACKSMLDTFASLYDAVRNTRGVEFDFYSNPLCCAVLAYRNAKHHNKAHGIRGIHRYSQQHEHEDLLLVDFPAGEGEEGGVFIDHFASWGDFCQLLDMPSAQSRLRAGSRELIRDRIGADEFENFSNNDGKPYHRVFINMIPIIIGSGSEFIPHLKNHIHPQSTESKYFISHFEDVVQANFADPQYLELPTSLFG